MRGCIGCGKCGELDRACVFDDDMVNELIKAAQQADGFIFGTPVYYAHPTGRILSVLDRAFYAGGAAFEHKPGCGDRRGSPWRHHGIVRRAQQIFHHQTDACCGVDLLEWRARTRAGRAALDEEGMAHDAQYRHNMAWMLKCIELGRENGIEPPIAEAGA